MSADAVISKIFDSMDADHGGTITKSEMDIIFKKLDADSSGKISADEWKSAFTSVYGGTGEQAAKLFTYLDKKKAGEISIDSFHALFNEMDSDKSGDVTTEEFRKFWLKLLS